MLKIEAAVLAVLDAASVNGNLLVLNGQLDRDLYLKVNKVLDAIGGKWSRKVKAHLFDEPVQEMLDAILETGTYSRVKQDFGQFDSTPAVVDRIIELAGLLIERLVLEPSAGIGNIVEAAERRGAIVTAWEVDAKRLHALKDRCDLAGGAHLSDFLSVHPIDRPFDVVLMNPPFAKQVDIDHVLHAFKFLKPGGRLVSVMSQGVMFRTNRKAAEFRAFVEQHGGRFEELPAGSFSASGTEVRACIVVIDA